MTATISRVLTRDQLTRLASMPNGVLLSSESPSFKTARQLCAEGFLKSECVSNLKSPAGRPMFFRFYHVEPVQLEFDLEGAAV